MSWGYVFSGRESTSSRSCSINKRKIEREFAFHSQKSTRRLWTIATDQVCLKFLEREPLFWVVFFYNSSWFLDTPSHVSSISYSRYDWKYDVSCDSATNLKYLISKCRNAMLCHHIFQVQNWAIASDEWKSVHTSGQLNQTSSFQTNHKSTYNRFTQ